MFDFAGFGSAWGIPTDLDLVKTSFLEPTWEVSATMTGVSATFALVESLAGAFNVAFDY